MVVNPLECGGSVCDLLHEITVTSSSVLFYLCVRVFQGDSLPDTLEENLDKQF